jgi:hypothetical protein
MDTQHYFRPNTLRALIPVAGLLLAACSTTTAASSSSPTTAPAPEPARIRAAVVDTMVAFELNQQIEELELKLLERDMQLGNLEESLEDARGAIVRAMARAPAIASRAEAASAMAEAEIELEALAGRSEAVGMPEIQQARDLLELGTAAHLEENYGGARYFGIQARTIARAGKVRLDKGRNGALREGEALFALPLPLSSTARSNIREGPGTNFRILFTVENGTPLEGYSYVDQWIWVVDDQERSGWIFRTLASRGDLGGS